MPVRIGQFVLAGVLSSSGFGCNLGINSFLVLATGVFFLVSTVPCAAEENRATADPGSTNSRTFLVRGVLKEIKPGGTNVVIQHETIPGFMEAMTMPFHVRKASETAGLKIGDWISFRLVVTTDRSWIEQVTAVAVPPGVTNQSASAFPPVAPSVRAPQKEFVFTNELGQSVDLRQLQGQALAITFFFTRCPIPEYCPRLSKNFAEASQLLTHLPDAPTNWQFLSVTFDPAFDTPAVLKSYGERYHYDPRHWHFLTGSRERIEDFAGMFGLRFERDGALFNHDFRTIVINATGRVDMIYPVGGNLSSNLVTDILKAAAAGAKP